jgi:hypothetical protein
LGIEITASKSSPATFNKSLRLAGYGYFTFDGPFATPRREGLQSLLVLELPFFLPSSCIRRAIRAIAGGAGIGSGFRRILLMRVKRAISSPDGIRPYDRITEEHWTVLGNSWHQDLESARFER